MGFVFSNNVFEVLAIFLLVIWGFYRYLTRNYDFWAKRGVPFRPAVFPFGSLKDLILTKQHMGYAYDSVYREFSGERFCGVIELRTPVLVVRDPELVKQILIKDFNYFVNRNPFEVNHKEWISNHLFLMEEESWRSMRNKLSPAFSSGKMKKMFELMVTCSDQLRECLETMIKTKSSINVKDLLARFTMDIIATCAFGLEINSMIEQNTEFYKMGVSIFKPDSKILIQTMIIQLFPTLSQMLNIQRLPAKPKEMLYSMVSDTVSFREKNNVTRNDFLDILIKLKNNKSILDGTEDEFEMNGASQAENKEGLSLKEMTAQAFIFFAAGFETASSTMTHCLYELAQNEAVQQRLWREVEEVLSKHGGRVTYQALQDMKYMDQVIDETLRMYASLSVLHRCCTRQYKVPGSDLVLEPGQKVYIPTYALHHDPLYYPDPDKFDPERFTPDNVRDRHPFVHLPFGDGPRNCIGKRFGLMQTKIGLTTILSQFQVEMAPDTPVPIRPNPPSFVTLPKQPVFLKVTKR